MGAIGWMHEAGKKDGLPGWCNTRISEYLFEIAQLRKRGRVGGQQNRRGADFVNFGLMRLHEKSGVVADNEEQPVGGDESRGRNNPESKIEIQR